MWHRSPPPRARRGGNGAASRGGPRRPGALALLALALASACASAGTDGPTARQSAGAPDPDRLVVAVRHAEKADDSRDPPLSAAGEVRAASLAVLLADAGIERVFSTDYDRARSTARPTAEAAGTDIELYDPRDLEGLARRLLDAPERAILVVGHSNTTPALVEALTGEPAEPMPETEYDRLYRVWVASDGSTRVEVERY